MCKHCVPLESFIATLNRISDFVDVDTKDHSRRTKAIALNIGIAMKWKGDNLLYLGYGADVHDVGKVAVNQDVFRQPVKLTKGELAAVRKHPEFGYDMVEHAGLPLIVTDSILYHHEHWDGSGYPKGLRNDDIPVHANIVCISDVWESINSDRPYRRAMTREVALEFMDKHSTWFSHKIYKTFLSLIRKGEL